MKKHFKSVQSPAHSNKLNEDLSSLHFSKPRSEFDSASLWMRQWCKEKLVQYFLSYFITEYLEYHERWFEGYAINKPSIKNCLESTKRSIQDKGTMCQRLELGQLFPSCKNSSCRSNNYCPQSSIDECKLCNYSNIKSKSPDRSHQFDKYQANGEIPYVV